MIYADTDFFLALMKKSDWLKSAANQVLMQYRGTIWTSPTTLTELLLVGVQFDIDLERMIVDVLELAELRGADESVFIMAARYIKKGQAGVFDAIHAAFCGREGKIISSDKVFDKLGLQRIALEKYRNSA